MRKAALVALLTFALTEVGVRVWHGRCLERWAASQGGKAVGFSRTDPALGTRPLPNLRLDMTSRRGGRLLYRVRYTTDALGRRVVPLPKGTRRRHFLLFFGCSFTFGVGVNDDETLPASVGRLATGFRPYNYAMSATGPNHTLALLESPQLRSEIPEPDGLALYTFIDDHVQRAVGSPRVYHWGRHEPFYRLENGEVRRDGDFTSAEPLRSFLYRAVGASAFLSELSDHVFPHLLTDRDFELTAKLLIAARDRFRARFHSDRFHVLFYPGSRLAPRVIPWLTAAGVPFLDYSALDFTPPRFRAADGGHPSAEAHRRIARLVVRDLGLGNQDSARFFP